MMKTGKLKPLSLGMTLEKEPNVGSAYQKNPWRFLLVSVPVGTWPLAGPTSPGPTSKNKSQGAKPLVGSVGACCRGNPSQRPPSWLGCPVWLQVSVPVPLCWPLCQLTRCPVFLGGGSRCGAVGGGERGASERTLGTLTEHNGLCVRPRLDLLVWRLCDSGVCDCVLASVELFPGCASKLVT